MSFIASLSLRQILALDAVSSGAMGLLLVAAAGLLEPFLGISAGFQQAAGAILIPYAAFVAWLASRSEPSRALTWLIVGINAVWVIESLLALAAGVISPTALGIAFVIAQAIVVGVLAELQIMSLRRGRPATA
jgi:hypothetical protein